VTKPGGRVFVDCPNGAFPIDFWHGGAGGRARWHRRGEGFLPTFDDIRRLARENVVRAISPHRRFAFRQVGVSPDGRAVGYHSATGARSIFMQHFRTNGVELAEEMFVPVAQPPDDQLY